MHYGHPDVFDRVFHITRGGISKASRVINISEDIFAGFNSSYLSGMIYPSAFSSSVYLCRHRAVQIILQCKNIEWN